MASLPLLASLTKYMPFDGIPHAGGEYAMRHYDALGVHFDITAIAPSTPDNRYALTRSVPALRRRMLISGSGILREGRLKTLSDVDSAMRGSSAPRVVETALRKEPQWLRRLSNADVIELQWSEMASLAPWLKLRLPEAKLVFVAHDLITQRWQRLGDGHSNPLARAAYRAAASVSRRRETNTLANVDVTVVFSDKDAEYAHAMLPTARVEVVRPGFPAGADSRHGMPPTVLFTGAMSRPDNHRGVEWFLSSVWPLVVESVPDATFVVAGASPPESLVRAAAAARNVRLTGFVDSLDPYYETADVFVVPLFTGAGVKFKTIDAMMRGIPIVSTPVGIEGIGTADLYLGVSDHAAQFAAAVITGLRRRDDDSIKRSKRWAEENYGLDQFRTRLLRVYRGLLGDNENAEDGL